MYDLREILDGLPTHIDPYHGIFPGGGRTDPFNGVWPDGGKVSIETHNIAFA